MPVPERPQINISSISVAGIGGLGMIGIVVIMAFALPAVRWFLLVALAGGVIGGAAFVAYRRWVKVEPPHGPTLMVETPAAPQVRAANDEPVDPSVKLAPVATAR